MSDILRQFNVPSISGNIDKDVIQNIWNFTKHFPEELSPFFGYEIQLNSGNKNADFLCCISDSNQLQSFVTDLNHTIRINEANKKGLRLFSDYWLNPSVAKQINNIWLEFDYEEIERSSSKFCFFFGPKTSLNKLETILLTEKVFSRVFNKNFKPGVLKLFLKLLHELDDFARVTQVGMMHAREDESLRLFIQGNEKDWTLKFLRSMEHPFLLHKDFTTFIETILIHCSKVDLDINISEKVDEAIGFECYCNTIENALLLLNSFVEFELCNAQKAAHMSNFLNTLHYDSKDDYQPFLSHFKVAFKPTKGLNAKAYLGFVTNALAPKIIQIKPTTLTSHV